MTERKLYVEFRLQFNPDVNQETLKELAKVFQEHIYDEWNNTLDVPAFETHDVTYEIVMEITDTFNPPDLLNITDAQIESRLAEQRAEILDAFVAAALPRPTDTEIYEYLANFNGCADDKKKKS